MRLDILKDITKECIEKESLGKIIIIKYQIFKSELIHQTTKLSLIVHTKSDNHETSFNIMNLKLTTE